MRSVLIIDDEFGIVEGLSALLADEGYRPFSAANGKQGLAKMEEALPDVILLDFMMPVLDGPGVLAALRRHAAWRTIPVIVMSSVSERTVRERCGNTYQAYLQKPFDIERLFELLDALLPAEQAEAPRARRRASASVNPAAKPPRPRRR